MKKFDQINVIPMIDVMLVLLAIVLTTASFIVQDQLNIELPKTQHTQPISGTTQQKAIQITINAQGQLFFNNQPRSLANLKHDLNLLHRDQPIRLKVDKKTHFGRFAQVVDLLKAQHFDHLTILTEHQG